MRAGNGKLITNIVHCLVVLCTMCIASMAFAAPKNLNNKALNPKVKITANYSDPRFGPAKVSDGNISTVWSNSRSPFIYYDHLVSDLGQPAVISAIAVSIKLRNPQSDGSDSYADKERFLRVKKRLPKLESKLTAVYQSLVRVRSLLYSAQSIRSVDELRSHITRMQSELRVTKQKVVEVRLELEYLRSEMQGLSFLKEETAKITAMIAQLHGVESELDGAINDLGRASNALSSVPNVGVDSIPDQVLNEIRNADRKVSNIQTDILLNIGDVQKLIRDFEKIDLADDVLGKKVRFRIEYFDGKDWRLAKLAIAESRRGLVKYTLNKSIVAQKWRIRDFRNEFKKGRRVEVGEWSLLGVLSGQKAKNTADGDHWRTLSRAPVDECFVRAGARANQYPKPAGPCQVGVPKRNEAYVWGLTHFRETIGDQKISDRLYYGTGANVMCLAIETYLLVQTPYYRPNDLVCEFSTNYDGMRDFRPPSIYIYDFFTGKQTKPELTEEADLLRQFTTGFRSAGNHKGIVFIGGPNLDDSVNMFAFIGATGTLIGGTVLDYGYSSFRKMRVINDELYIGMGGAESPESSSGGAVLRWKGDVTKIFAGDTSTLFDFEIVGTNLAAEATEVNQFENRIFASSWPDENTKLGGSLWRSPPLPLSNKAVGYKKIWERGAGKADSLVFTRAGVLLLRDPQGAVLWSSRTLNMGVTKLLLQDNGKLAMYDKDDELVWCSDPNWKPKYPRVNAIATANATRIEPGVVLEKGKGIRSRTEHYQLALTQNGDLVLRANVIPWQRIWSGLDYDPDPLVASTYGVGPAREFKGWLYWGTMHVPSAPVIKFELIKGKTFSDEVRGRYLTGYHREGSIFRGRNLGKADQQIQLLYGGQALDEKLKPGEYPRRLAGANIRYTNPQFKPEMNKMGLTPLYGKGGFDNPWNNYIWSMTVYNDDLYIGTMDHSQIVLADQTYIPYDFVARSFVPHNFGSDLYKIEHTGIGAMPVSLDGLGNFTNYGIRTMVTDGNSVFMGSANNANLHNRGGWHLYEFVADDKESQVGSIHYAFIMIMLLLCWQRRKYLTKY